MQLDAVRFSSSLNENKLKFYELLATTARLSAEVENTPWLFLRSFYRSLLRSLITLISYLTLAAMS